MQIRRGTPEEWSISQEVLAEGQLAVSWDGSHESSPVLKVGNGVDKFSDLPELNSGGSTFTGTVYTGTSEPDDSLGVDGDVYYYYEE